ncbi:hypothetical protein FRB99_007781 [Tulasnella sp. 403]|nr:hypothetical protein FRB99_007781 [Tulasnella sp. 403]
MAFSEIASFRAKGMTCEEFRNPLADEQLLRRTANKNQWRRCPKCKILVERVSGCPHMTCRCGQHFCHLCGADWKGGGCTRPGGCTGEWVEDTSEWADLKRQVSGKRRPSLPGRSRRDRYNPFELPGPWNRFFDTSEPFLVPNTPVAPTSLRNARSRTNSDNGSERERPERKLVRRGRADELGLAGVERIILRRPTALTVPKVIPPTRLPRSRILPSPTTTRHTSGVGGSSSRVLMRRPTHTARSERNLRETVVNSFAQPPPWDTLDSNHNTQDWGGMREQLRSSMFSLESRPTDGDGGPLPPPTSIFPNEESDGDGRIHTYAARDEPSRPLEVVQEDFDQRSAPTTASASPPSRRLMSKLNPFKRLSILGIGGSHQRSRSASDAGQMPQPPTPLSLAGVEMPTTSEPPSGPQVPAYEPVDSSPASSSTVSTPASTQLNRHDINHTTQEYGTRRQRVPVEDAAAGRSARVSRWRDIPEDKPLPPVPPPPYSLQDELFTVLSTSNTQGIVQGS